MTKIPESVLGHMKAHAERTYPEECCGLMLGEVRGEERVIQAVEEIDNSQDANRQRRFLVSPIQYLQAERTAASRGLTLLGFYHSHPDHPAVPSAFDTEHALPWFSYVILSVAKGRFEKVTAWVLKEDRGRFDEQQVAVEAAGAGVRQR